MIEIGNKNEKIKNKDVWNHCHNFLILLLLRANHRLYLLHMAKSFLYLHETNDHINEFDIVYIINPTLHVNKAFKDQAEKCMNNTFGNVTQPFIENITTKKNTCVLALIIFHDTKHSKENQYFTVLRCVIYTIIDNFVCIDDLDCQYVFSEI